MPGLRKIGKAPPPRVVLNAVEGWGKSTLGAFAPNPAYLMARGESGLVTLRGNNLVPDVDAAEINNWPGLLALLDELCADQKGYKSIVMDALGGFERLCFEEVCRRDFKNDFTDKGFLSFGRGPEVSVNDWIQMLVRLDLLNQAGLNIIILSHSQIKPFKNPLGEEFSRYISACHEKVWGVTHKWADAVFFGTYIQVLEETKTNRKVGIGGNQRVIYTQRTDAFDAKNRYAMPDALDFSAVPADQMYSTLWQAMGQK